MKGIKMLKDLVVKSRSYRSFTPGVSIPNETLVDFIDTARQTSAAMNIQPLKYRIVTSDEERAGLMSVCRFASSLGIKLPPEGHEPAAYIVICHDCGICEPKPIFLNDVGICAETIMLAAAEAGFGGCIIGSASPENIRAALGLADNLLPQLIVALGKPDEEVRLTEANDGKVKYYRDGAGIHYVPKRKLEDIII